MNIDEVSELLEQKTPCFYFDARILADNIKTLKSRLAPDIKLCYSVKSNPFMTAYGAMNADFVEVCSKGELQICKELSINPSKIIVGGVYKSEEEIRYLAANPTARISIESISQLEMLSRIAVEVRKEPRVLLRLSSGNQFGMNAGDIIDITNHPEKYPNIMFTGIHYYSSTQKKKAAAIISDLNQIIEVLKESKLTSPEIEYGPGIGVPIFEKKRPEWFGDIVDSLIEECNRISRSYPITLEMGRFLTADIGCYITRIVDKKNNAGRNFYIVDGGIHHLGYYGQMNGVPAPVVHYVRENSAENVKVTICGSLCTANDILAKDLMLPEGNPGDCLIFENAGAYAITEARTMFLSHPMPAVIIKDNICVSMAREHIDTYGKNMISKGEKNNMDQNTYDRVVICIQNACEKKFPHIRLESKLQEDLGMESLQLVMLQVGLEEEFSYTFDPLEDNFREIFSTVESVCNYFMERI